MPFDFPENCKDADKYSYTATEERMFIAAEYTDGVFPQIRMVKDNILEPEAYVGECLKTVAADDALGVVVSAGIGICGGTKFCNTAGLLLGFKQASAAQTIDIVVEVDYTLQDMTIKAQIRSEGKTLESALTRTVSVYQLALATVVLPANAAKVVLANITDHRLNTAICPNGKPVCGLVGAAMQADTRMVIADILKAWDEWFDNIQTQLGDDAAGNLMNMVNDLKAYDRAQDVEIGKKADQTSLNTTNANVAKAQATADRVFAINPYANKATFSASGTWICPAGVTRIGLFMQDGGTGGRVIYPVVIYIGFLAASGAHTTFKNISVVPGQSYQITVGAGGGAGNNNSLGYPGGLSSAFGKKVADGIEFKGFFYGDSYAYPSNGVNVKYNYVTLSDSTCFLVRWEDGYNGVPSLSITPAQTSSFCNGYQNNAITQQKTASNGGQNIYANSLTGFPGGNGIVEIYY